MPFSAPSDNSAHLHLERSEGSVISWSVSYRAGRTFIRPATVVTSTSVLAGMRDRSQYVSTNPFVAAAAELALGLWILGYPERAVKMQAQALSYASKLNQVLTNGAVHCIAGAQLEQLFQAASTSASFETGAPARSMSTRNSSTARWLGATGSAPKKRVTPCASRRNLPNA